MGELRTLVQELLEIHPPVCILSKNMKRPKPKRVKFRPSKESSVYTTSGNMFAAMTPKPEFGKNDQNLPENLAFGC